jgi:dienelactone hydrolase
VAEVVLFHHALGVTEGVLAFADELRAAGHVVHVPDLYQGELFPDVATGVVHAEALGFGEILERGRRAAGPLPAAAVYAGLSLGVLPAQMLAQTKPGARAAVLMHASIPLGQFGPAWPKDVPLQIHVMERDELGDVEVAREVAASVDEAELFLYPGDRHLFTDRTLAEYDEHAAAQVLERVRGLLDRV